MITININGKKYEIYREELRYYDYYYYKGVISERSPIDTKVVGYVVMDKCKVAICKRSYAKALPFLYALLGVGTVAVCAASILVLNMDVTVPHWVPGIADVKEETLDNGVVSVSRKFAYSQYATYDGSNIKLFYSAKGSTPEIAVRVGDKTTDYVSYEDGYSFNLELPLSEEDVVQGQLLVRSGTDISEYPIIIEYTKTVEAPDIKTGSLQDNIAARNEYSKQESTTAVDFSNLDVITYKSSEEQPWNEYLDVRKDEVN